MDGTPLLVHISGMTETMMTLLFAMIAFVGGHFILSSLPVRHVVIAQIGVGGFRSLYSMLSLVGFAWVIFSYSDAFPDAAILWALPDWSRMVPVVVMPFAAILHIAGLTSRNVTAVGGERHASDPKPTGGITTISRHPMMVGFSLWAISHLVANGDAASVILFGGLLVLSIGGILHIDHRRQVTLGADWGPIALTTSIIPFVAALQGRTKVDWAGIGLWRVAAGLALYVALLYGHKWISGVSILPG